MKRAFALFLAMAIAGLPVVTSAQGEIIDYNALTTGTPDTSGLGTLGGGTNSVDNLNPSSVQVVTPTDTSGLGTLGGGTNTLDGLNPSDVQVLSGDQAVQAGYANDASSAAGLNGALSSVTSQCQSGGLAGGLGGILGSLLNGVTGIGGAFLGNTISQGIGGPFGGIIGSYAGKLTTTLANQGLQSLLGGTSIGNFLGIPAAGSAAAGAAGAAAGIAGGSITGAVGLLGGAVGISVTVPVNNPISDPTITTHVPVIRGDADVQLEVTCVGNVLVRNNANQFTAQDVAQKLQAAANGNGGWQYFSHGYPSENNTVYNSQTSYFIGTVLPQAMGGNPQLQAAQQNFANYVAQDSNLQLQLNCPSAATAEACRKSIDSCPGGNSQEKWNSWIQINGGNVQCSASGAKLISATNGIGSTVGRQGEQTLVEIEGSGYISNVQCLDPAGYTGPMQNCHAWITVTPGSTVGSITNIATDRGSERQSHANEIGNLVNSFLAALAQQALTSLTGLIGLSQSQNGNPSYLSQTVNSQTETTNAQAQGTLQSEIEASIGIEVSYAGTLTAMINNLNSTKAALAAEQSCYAKLSVSSINGSTPQQIAAEASTTIATVIQPEINQLNQELTNSQNALTQLSTLDNEVQSAQTTTDINTISNAYDALASSGALHSSADLQNLQDDASASAAVLQGLTQNANTALAACQQAGGSI